jgi:hypothetical protein
MKVGVGQHRYVPATVKLVPLVAIATPLLIVPVLAGGPWQDIAQLTGKDANGEIVFKAVPVAEQFRNPWPAESEREFQQRARGIIAAQMHVKANAGNTYFENEKRSYGYLMAHALGGTGMAAVKDLQLEDAQRDEWHSATSGIDYYACFTLKHQLRKYFYFGGLLEPAYRQRMFEGAKTWTAQDPLNRPHPAFKGPKEGWGPDAKNSWVDVRSTENLYLMRVTSVYLMAEETGNRETTARYKQHLLDYTRTLYRVGMGEWDSENYHGHSLAPLANLYDFAKDPEVKLAAKACLDFMFTIGAVKYYRGGFNGPTKRDYNHPQPFGGSAAGMLWVMFGDCPRANDHWESDEVHLITSAYRPPLAVMKLARKEFAKPLELFAAKPSYTATTGYQSDSKPEYLETQYFGHSFQMGSLTGGTSVDGGDVNGFKILVHAAKDGAAALHCVPGADPACPGSPAYQKGKTAAENRVAQFGNLALWLVRDGKSPWTWVIPESVKVSAKDGVTFLACERTWVAIRPLGASEFKRDEALTAKVAGGEKPPFPGHQVLTATGNGTTYCGVAVEVGEQESHGSFAAFQEAVLKAKVDQSKLAEGVVQYQAASGKSLGFHWDDNPLKLGVWRNGKRRDLAADALFLYRAGEDDATLAPLHAKWGEGKIYVEAGGEAFACAVDERGRVEFANGKPEQVRSR